MMLNTSLRFSFILQLLLRHRTTELDAQSDDGTTPLIYATRFMVDDMVEDLIKAGAKVNLTDKQGMYRVGLR